MSDAVRGSPYPGQGSSIVASTAVEGGGSGGIAVEEDASPIVAAATTLNFIGATVTNAGGGVADVTIAAGGSIAVDEGGTPIVADATKLNFVGATVTDAGGGEATVTVTAGSFPDIVDTPGVSVVVSATTDGLIVNAPTVTNPGLTVQYPDADGDALLSVFSADGGGIAVSKDTSSGGFGYNVVTIIELLLAGNLAFGQLGAVGTAGETGTLNNFEIGPTGPLAFNTGSAGLTLTGLVAVGGTDAPLPNAGVIRILGNLGTGTLTLENQNAGSLLANRFTLPSAANVVIPAGGFVILYNSPSSSDLAPSTWLLLAKSF
jgi:hypothetical protein